MRWAIRARVDGALDFGGLRRYDRAAVLTRRAVYAEYADRERLAGMRETLGYCAAVLPVAKDRSDANRKYVERLRDYMAVLGGEQPGGASHRMDDLRAQWERMMGIKWGSPEFERLQRDREIAMDLIRKKAK